MGWSYCRIQDYVAVARCYKCQCFVYTSKYCRSGTDIYGHCASSSHSFKEFPNKKKSATCSNCKMLGMSSDHCATSKECPSYISSLKRLILRTDYGDDYWKIYECITEKRSARAGRKIKFVQMPKTREQLRIRFGIGNDVMAVQVPYFSRPGYWDRDKCKSNYWYEKYCEC